MSTREGVFCDFTRSEPLAGSVPCSKLAVGACCICEKDVCADHQLLPEGGLRIDIGLYALDSTSKTSAPWAPNIIQRLPICVLCAQLARLVLDSAARDSLSDVVTVVKNLRATITVKVLEEDEKRKRKP